MTQEEISLYAEARISLPSRIRLASYTKDEDTYFIRAYDRSDLGGVKEVYVLIPNNALQESPGEVIPRAVAKLCALMGLKGWARWR